MPLTIFDAQAKDPAVRPATVQPVDTSGTQRAGKVLEGIYTTMQDTFDTEALSTAQVDYARGLAELNAKYQGDTDFETAPKRYAEDLEALREGMGEELNKRVSEKFIPWAELKGISATTQFDATNRKKYRQHKLADGKDNEDFLSNSIVNAIGDQARGMAWADGAIFWESRKGLYDNELQWANAYEAWRDKTTFSAALADLDRTGGLGFRPDPDLPPEMNRQLQTHAQLLRADSVRIAENNEKIIAQNLKNQQDAYVFGKMTEMSNPKPGVKPLTLTDVENDLRLGRINVKGAEKLRQALTGSGAPTSKQGLYEVTDAFDDLRSEKIKKKKKKKKKVCFPKNCWTPTV